MTASKTEFRRKLDRALDSDRLRVALHRALPALGLRRADRMREVDGPALRADLTKRKKKAIEFRSGWPISVRSNLVSECLGHYLVEKKLVTQAQLDESIARMRAGEGLQGENLIAMDVLEEQAVVDALE